MQTRMQVASGLKVIDLLMDSSKYPAMVQKNTDRFRRKMVAAGFTIAGMNHPICPVMLGDAKLASTFADEMLSRLLLFSNCYLHMKHAHLFSCFFFDRERNLCDWL